MLLRTRTKYLSIALAIAPFCIVQSAIAAPAKRPVAKRAAAPAKVPTPVEVLAHHLAQNSLAAGENIADACRRTDFKLLATALSMNSDLLHQAKGEYETSEQFNERVGKLSTAVNGGEAIYCQPLDDNEDLPFSYNADLQRFEASFDRNQNVWRDIKQLGSYRSKTRMGAAATVKASAEFEYNVSLTMPQDDDACGATSSYSSSYKFNVPIAIAEAPALKARGYVAFIGKFVPPYISEEEREGSPTLDDPYDEYERDLVVNFRPARIVLVDGGGRKMWSCTPGFPSPNSPPQPKGNPGAWVTVSDYPSAAIRENRSGVVRFSVGVDPTGAVTECNVTASSGYADLDFQTCAVLRRRARFKPATDENANPTNGIWASSFRWQM